MDAHGTPVTVKSLSRDEVVQVMKAAIFDRDAVIERMRRTLDMVLKEATP